MGWYGAEDVWYQLPDMGMTDKGYFNSVDDIIYNIIPNGGDDKAVLAGRVTLPSGAPAACASVSDYATGSQTPTTNLVANLYGVYGVVLPAGTSYEVRASAGALAGSTTMSAALASPSLANESFRGYVGEVIVEFSTTKYVTKSAETGNAMDVDVALSGTSSGTPLAWSGATELASTQFAAFEHVFAATGGDAPYAWRAEQTYVKEDGVASTYDATRGEAPYSYLDFENADRGVRVELGFDFLFGDQLVSSVLLTQEGIRFGADEIGTSQYPDAQSIRVSRTATSFTVDFAGVAYTLCADGSITVAFRPDITFAMPRMKVFGRQLEFPLESDGSPLNDITLVRQGLPVGLVLDSMNGKLSGRPLLAGEQEFDVTVTDPFGESLTETVLLTVSEPTNRKPVIAAIDGWPDSGSMFLRSGSNQVFAVHVSDPDDDNVCVRMYVNGDLYSRADNVPGTGEYYVPFAFSRELSSDYNAKRSFTVKITVSDATWPEKVSSVWEVKLFRDWYVDAATEEDWDIQDGSPEHPFAHPMDAHVGDGDTVHLKQGVYEGQVFMERDARVAYVADDFPALTQIGSISAVRESYGDEGFAGWIPYTNCVFRGLTVRGGFVRGGQLVNCRVEDVVEGEMDMSTWELHPAEAVKYARLVNCVVAGNTNGAVAVASSRIYNCTVTGNAGCGLDADSEAYNSIVWGNGGGNVQDGAALSSCCTEQDPLFVDAVNGDFRLLSGSPCLDAGSNAWLVEGVTNDLAGAARVQNGIVDIGACEGAVGDLPTSSPSVAVGEVSSGVPWSTVTVNYTLGGMDAATDYKVVFDVTANGVTRGVTNAAAKLTDGPASKVIDTAALFGAANADPKAKVRVSLIAVKTQADGVQLWEDGPYWAECNVGATKPEEYGYYFWWGDTVGYTWNGSTWVSVQDGSTISFVNASPENTLSGKDVSDCLDDGNLKSDYDAATAYLGAPWRMPTYEEFAKLVDKNVCTAKWTENWNGTGTNGYVVTGKTAGYTDKSIFLPAAGGGGEASFSRPNLDGRYWSSSPNTYSYFEAFNLDFKHDSFYVYGNYKRYYGFTVRPVRVPADAPSDEKEFALTAFRDLPANPTAEDIRAAVEASGAKDASRILAVIQGAADPVAAYAAFRQWAEGCGDLATVLASDYAGDSFALGAEKVFENEPKVEVSSAKMSDSGTMEIAVTVKDGEAVVAISSEKVAEMFEATSDLADWNSAETKLEPHVTDKTQGVASPVMFEVTPGDGTSDKAFLRIRKE